MMARQFLFTPLGMLRLAATDTALTALLPARNLGRNEPNSLTEQAAAQLEEYFAGKRQEFTVDLAPVGTEFQQRVWNKLREIPYGKTVTYGQLAAAMGQPTACRAVANAVGKNPLLIFLPCHRVVAAAGLGGFSGGLDLKRKLLRLEGVEISEKSPFSEKFFFTFR